MNSDFRNPIDIDNLIGTVNANPCFTRWNFDIASSSVTTQIIKIDNGIRVYKNGGVARFYQLTDYNLLNKTVSYAIGTSEGIFVGSCTVSEHNTFTQIGTHTGYLSVYQSTAQQRSVFSIYFNNSSEDSIDLYWAALYEGSYTINTLPDYIPKSVRQEMLDCGIPLYPKNLLKNSDFTNPSNVKRGMTSYSGTFYDIIDLWDCATPDGSTTTTKLTSNGLNFTHSDGSSQIYLRQKVSDFWKSNKNYTIGCYKNDGKFFYSGYYNSGDGKINIVIPSGTTVTSVVCYEGKYTEDMLPPYVPKGKHVEMLNCGVPLAPQNLLDNSDFSNPVNQRGSTSYSGSGYGIDRWYGNGSNQTVQVSGSYIKVTATSTQFCGIRQKVLRMSSLAGKTITFAAKVYSNVVPSIRFINASASTLAYKEGTKGTTTTLVLTYTVPSGATLDTVIPIIIAKATAADDYINIYWAAIYEGSYTEATLPEYVPKGYAAEYDECERCYKVLNIYIPPWLIEGTNIRRYGISYRPMRIAPTADVSGLKEYTTWTDLGSTINPYNSTSDRLLMSATTETSSTRVYLAGTLILSADP